MFRKYKFLVFILILTGISCNAGKQEITEVPSDLLSRRQMSSILTDIHVAESKVNAMNVFGDSLLKANLNHYAVVFKKNDCSEEQFKSSFSYYLSDPVELDSIYIDVLNNLTLLEAQHQARYIQEKSNVADSSVMMKPN